MKVQNTAGRDRKLQKRKHGMRVSGRSVFTIVKQIVKRGAKK